MKKSIFSAAAIVFLVMLSAGSVHATPAVPDTATTSVMLAPMVLVLGAISRFIKR